MNFLPVYYVVRDARRKREAAVGEFELVDQFGLRHYVANALLLFETRKAAQDHANDLGWHEGGRKQVVAVPQKEVHKHISGYTAIAIVGETTQVYMFERSEEEEEKRRQMELPAGFNPMSLLLKPN